MVDTRIVLSALWAAVMFLYVYGDLKTFYKPGIIEGILEGKAGSIKITQVFLLGSAVLMAIPALMIFLSLTVSYPVIRWANIILGIFYSGVMVVTMLMQGTWAYYIFFGIVEVVLTATIAWYAWNWLI
jgi:hypothetical protein